MCVCIYIYVYYMCVYIYMYYMCMYVYVCVWGFVGITKMNQPPNHHTIDS